MCFKEQEIQGVVITQPKQDQLQARQLQYGSRNVPSLTFRIQNSTDSSVWTVVYKSEMDGPLSLGDGIVVKGFKSGPNNFRATEIWLIEHLDMSGSRVTVSPPVRLACKRVCAVASCLYGYDSEQVQILSNYRDDFLLHHKLGTKFVELYYRFSPIVVVKLLEPYPLLEKWFRFSLDIIIKMIAGKR